jgi:hypothetical protein
MLVGLVLTTGPASAAPIHVDCPQDDLAAALSAAPYGGTVQVSGTCTGNFSVQKNLTIVGAPTATLDGGGAGRTLLIFGFHEVHLRHLTITGGIDDLGGGILFGGGLLTLDNVRVSGNSATGVSNQGFAHGGGIDVDNPAFVTITNSTIANNHVSASGTAGRFADGGGIYAEGQLTIVDSVVNGNTASATSTDNAGLGEGAGVFVFGTLSMTRTKITNNSAGGDGPDFASARGGGVFWSGAENDVASIVDSRFASNRATISHDSGAHAEGGGLWLLNNLAEPVSIRGTTFDGNQAIATSSGADADAAGGGIYGTGNNFDLVLHVSGSSVSNSSVTATGHTKAEGDGGAIELFGAGNLTKVRLLDNSITINAGSGNATGGGGGLSLVARDPFRVVSSTVDGNGVDATSNGGATSVGGGGIVADGFDPFTVRSSTISNNSVTSQAFVASSEADGGGLELLGKNTTPGDLVINSTVAGNTVGASGGNGPTSAGAGLYVLDQLLTLRFDTIVRNSAGAQGTSPFAGGGGRYDESGTATHSEGVLLALNTALTGPDCLGIATSEGFNLLGTQQDCAMTTVPSDQVNPAPKLGPLAANGGPTATVKLLTGSPALNKVPKAACQAIAKKDQRGVARPQGLKCDEGAFELKP